MTMSNIVLSCLAGFSHLFNSSSIFPEHLGRFFCHSFRITILICQKYTTGVLSPVDEVRYVVLGSGIFLSMLKNHRLASHATGVPEQYRGSPVVLDRKENPYQEYR